MIPMILYDMPRNSVYGALLEAVQFLQGGSDSRGATKQLPKLYCRDAADVMLKPMA